MYYFRSFIFFLLVAVFFCNGFAFASDAEDSMEDVFAILEENETVVTVSKRPTKQIESSTAVHVITAEEIHRLGTGSASLAHILSLIPGMNLTQYAPGQFSAAVRNKTEPLLPRMAVLIDGNPFHVDFFGGVVYSLLPFPLEFIERIEVIKGPAPLYGNRAFIGVINIITKKFDDNKGLAQFSGGNDKQIDGSLIQGGFVPGMKELKYLLSFNSQLSNEWNDVNGDGLKSDALEKYAAYGSVQYNITDHSYLNLKSSYADGVFYQTLGDSGFSQSDASQATTSLTYYHDFGKWGDMTFSHHWSLERVGLMPFFSIPGTFLKFWEHDFGLKYHLFKSTGHLKNDLTLGFDYELNGQKWFFMPNDQDIHNVAGYLQNELRLYDTFILSAGLRFDHQFYFASSNISFNSSIVYLLNKDHVIRAGLQKAFSTGTATDYFFSIATPGALTPVTTINTPNPQLDAEDVIYFDTGYKGKFVNGKISVFADMFYFRMDDVPQQFGFLNAAINTLTVQVQPNGSLESFGGEYGVKLTPIKYFRFDISHGVQVIEHAKGALFLAPNHSVPKHRVKSTAWFQFMDERLWSNVSLVYSNSFMDQNAGVIPIQIPTLVKIDPKINLSLGLGYWIIKDHLELSGGVYNLLNRRQPQSLLFNPASGMRVSDTPGIHGFGRLTFKW